MFHVHIDLAHVFTVQDDQVGEHHDQPEVVLMEEAGIEHEQCDMNKPTSWALSCLCRKLNKSLWSPAY